MKKYLALLLMLMSATWASAENYQLWIAGTQVTDNNKNNITGPGIESAYGWDGKVSYNPTTKTLTLENIHIKSTSNIGIRNEISGVTIWLCGRYNEVQDQWYTSKDGIVSVGNLTFDGEGMLKVGGSYGIYIRPNTGDVTIDGDARVEVNTYEHTAVCTDYNSTGSLIVKGRKAMLMATSTTGTHDIYGFKNLTLQDGITINKPTGVEYDTTLQRLRDGDSNVGNGTTVVIGKRIAIDATNFPDAELRRAVTEKDANNSGYLERDESYQFEHLILEGSKVNDLTGLNLLWDIRSIEANLLNIEGITFTNNTLLQEIYFQMGTLEYLEVDNCRYLQTVWAHGHKLSYVDMSSNIHLLNIDLHNNSLVTFIPPRSMPNFSSGIEIYGNHLTSSKMHAIVEKLHAYDDHPERHEFRVMCSYDGANEQNQITAEDLAALKAKNWTPILICKEKGEWVYKEYEGYKEYDLWVGDNLKVTEANQDDIFGDNGGMSYNPTTKTLSLMNDYEFSTNGIQSYIDGLTIKCLDNSTLDCRSDAIDLYGNATITGNHRLAVKSKYGVGIFVDEGKTLTIDNATLEMSAQMPCILGATTTGDQKLSIKDSNIEAHSNSSSVAISGFPAGITFEGCAITEPAGGYVKDGNIVDKDGNWAYDVKIEIPNSAAPTFDFVLQDGTTLPESYANNQYNAINVLLAGGQLVEMYKEATKTSTYCKPSGKKLFTLEPYNNKGDKAYFLTEGVETADGFSYDYSDDMEGLGNEIWNYPYQDGYDMDGALEFIEAFSAINLSFDIPEVRPSVDMIIRVKDGMNAASDFDLQQYAALMAMWQYFGAIQFGEEDDQYVYKTNDGKPLCYMSMDDAIVTLAEGVTAADQVYYRILHKDREAIKGEGGVNLMDNDFDFGEILRDVRSITLTVEEGTPTGITDVSRSEERGAWSENTPSSMYNLSGQRISDKQNRKGIYIQNGKKVVVK